MESCFSTYDKAKAETFSGLLELFQCERSVVNTSLSLGYISLMRSPQLSIADLLPRFRLVKKSILMSSWLRLSLGILSIQAMAFLLSPRIR